jgi:transposase
MTSFVDLDPTHAGGLLGLAPGRSGASVRGWLALQSEQFRAGIRVVAVEPSAPSDAALREALPHAELVVDRWHLDRLGSLMLTRVRQRGIQQVHGHRGRKSNDSWAYRQLLLRGARHLSDRQWAPPRRARSQGRCLPTSRRPTHPSSG